VKQFEARKLLKRKEIEADELEKTIKALRAWINGDEFEDAVQRIESARKSVEDTRRHLTSI
jgi:hypothetical protein